MAQITRRRVGVTPLVAALLAILLPLAACDRGPTRPTTTPAAEIPAGTPLPAPEPGHGLLFVRDDGLVRRPTPEAPEQIIRRSTGLADFVLYPRWSPDGRLIAYAANRRDADGTSGHDIVVSRPDGSEARTLRRHAVANETVEGLAWAAGGRSLYAALLTPKVTDGGPTGAALRLLLVDLAGGEPRPIAQDAAYPDASPDGRRILYVTLSPSPPAAGRRHLDRRARWLRRAPDRAARPGDRRRALAPLLPGRRSHRLRRRRPGGRRRHGPHLRRAPPPLLEPSRRLRPRPAHRPVDRSHRGRRPDEALRPRRG